MKVEVVRSARRRKTVQARMVEGVLRVHIPARMSVQEEQQWVSEMVGRMERRATAARIDLMSRARSLARQYGLEVPDSIRWVDNQESRWGSCTPAHRTIRISSRLAREPMWVIDYVIVHELAHLSVSGHGARFWRLVERYPLAERARGFLIARGLETGEPDADIAPDELTGPPVGLDGGNGRLPAGSLPGR
jgi:predicted metal-dependent hydrolase